MADTNFCVGCGAGLRADASFCGACGRPVSGAAAAPSAPSAPSATLADGSGGSATAARTGRSGRSVRVAGLAVVLILVGVGLGTIILSGSDDEDTAADNEVLLEAVASAGPAPFTPSLQPETAVTSSSAPSSTAATVVDDGGRRRAQGPFGGTGDDSLCDRELLVDFLTDADNRALAIEWARVLDVRVKDIPAVVRALVPTTLTADARVTNHRWDGRRAVPYQAVLQQGTAVLVDTDGNLVARCRCGNPLLPPVELADPVYTGPRWERFDPTVIVVVVPSPTPIYPPGGVVSSSTTTVPPSRALTDAEEATRLIREALEACARASVAESGGFISAADIEALLPRISYTPTLIDGGTRTYRVAVSIPGSDVSSGSFVSGSDATWDVNLSSGEVTPADDSAREASVCLGLG